MRTVKRSLVVLLAVVLAFSLVAMTGCTKTEGEEPAGTGETKKETIKIGVQTSLTGGLADYGFAAQEGLKLAAKDLTGFKAGDTEYTIELVIKDDKGEAAEAPIVAQALVDEDVVAVIGALTSGNTLAALPIYKSAGIPVISGSATLAEITKGDYPNFARTCIGDTIQGKALADWVTELGYKKVTVFDDKGQYAVGLGDVVEENLKAAGVTTSREHCQEGDTDFSAQVQNIKDFAPEAVIFTGYHREAGLLTKQLREAGLDKIQMMGGDGVKSDEIVAEAGGDKNADGMLATIGGIKPEEMKGFEDFKARYKEATGKDPGPYAETNYDALVAIVEAIKKAESVEGADIQSALHEVTVTGVTGTFGFDEKGEFVAKGETEGLETISRFKLTGGKWELQAAK